MTYICAWCGKSLSGYQTNGDERHSHGICVRCALNLLPKKLHAEYQRRRELEAQMGSAA